VQLVSKGKTLVNDQSLKPRRMKTNGLWCSPKNQPDKLHDEHATTEGVQISVTSCVIRNYTNCCNVLQSNQEKEDGYIFWCNVSAKQEDKLVVASTVLVTKPLSIHLGILCSE